MPNLSSANIQDFEQAFISFYRKEVVYADARLTKEEFLNSMRVFLWFLKDNDFSDIREACKNTIAFMNGADPLNLGLLQFLNAYVQDGDLDCTAFIGGISNTIPQTVEALSATYKNLLKEDFPDLDVSTFTGLEDKFKCLANVRSFVLDYIGRFGHQHLEELTICSKFHPLEVEDILYELVMSDDRSNSEQHVLYDFVVYIMKSTKFDLNNDQNWKTEAIQEFLHTIQTNTNNS